MGLAEIRFNHTSALFPEGCSIIERHRIKTDILLLAAVSSAILIWNIWTGSLMSWDEGFYGAVSNEMFRSGDLINLYWRGMPWSDKPPLYMWMTNLFYNLSGINEFSVRLFSALCGVGTVIATYLLASKIYNRGAAIASSLILLSTWHFIWSSRIGMLDIALTMFVSASLLFFEMGTGNRKYLAFCPVFFALAFLTKGPAAMIAPVIIFFYAALSGKARNLIDPYMLAGTVLSAFILLWWHLSAFSAYGDGFIRGYFFQHLVTRTTTAMDGHTGNIFTYLRVIPNKGRPWSIIGLGLIPLMAFRALRNNEKNHLLPVIWASCVILIYSAVRTKLHWYIIPVYPALAVMTGRASERAFGKYTIPAVSLLFLCSLTYLTLEKDIFDMDYSPGIKATAMRVIEDIPENGGVFLFDISDPGLQFYLGLAGRNILDENGIRAAMRERGVYVFLSKDNIGRLPSTGYSVIREYPGYILIRT